MTNRQSFNSGLLLIALGVIVFFANFGLFNGMEGIIGAAVLSTGGFLFSRVYVNNQKHIWALLIAFGFFASAVAAISGAMAGAYFLAVLGSGFALSYFRNKKHWWAIIPAGVLASLAIIVGIDEKLPFLDDLIPAILFTGIAATFAFLYYLPEGGKRWAIYPAVGAIIIAIISSSVSGTWLLPVILIAVGAYLLRGNNFLTDFFNNRELKPTETVSSKRVETTQPVKESFIESQAGS